MKRRIARLWSQRSRLSLASALAPVLVAYLFVGSCGGDRSGFVFAFKAGRIAVTASWCEPASAKGRS